MKEELRALIAAESNPRDARNVVREVLQAHILAGLQRGGGMLSLAFHGGTALRFLYALPRYFEDLDFSLREPAHYDFRRLLGDVRHQMMAMGYAPDFKVSEQRTVHSAFVRFPGLLYEIGLSRRAEEVFAVKIEVDTRPPAGADYATTVVRRHVLLNLCHHDRPTLLAGKLHALLQRPYLKGRDVYDLAWYLADRQWPSPNLRYLNNALAQSGWPGTLPLVSWRATVTERLSGLDLAKALADVRPFLSGRDPPDWLSADHLAALVATMRS